MLKQKAYRAWIDLINSGMAFKYKSPIEIRKVRANNSVSLVLILISIPIILQHLWCNVWITAASLSIASLVGIVNLVLLRFHKNTNLSGHILTIDYIVVVCFISWNMGGYFDPVFSWIYLTPLLALILIDKKALVLYSILSLSIIVLMFMASYFEYTHHNPLPNEIYMLVSLNNRFFPLLIIGLMIYVFYAEREKAEERLKHLNHKLKNSKINLEKHIQERTKELNAAKTCAEQANKVKSVFLAKMSHEIRTPLNGVLGMAELLYGSPLNSIQKTYVKTIINSGSCLLTIINDILDLSKIESEHLKLENIMLNLHQLIEETVYQFAEKAETKNIELNYNIESTVPQCVEGDPTRIRQVLINLISNAIKFTAKGSVILEVSAQNHTAKETNLEFRVIDTGEGISVENIKKIFDSFTQADASVTRRHGGTGLGLNISRQLANLMQGNIFVNSKQGKGSEFIFHMMTHKTRENTKQLTEIPYDEKTLLIMPKSKSASILKRQLTHWGVDFDYFQTVKSAFNHKIKHHIEYINIIIPKEVIKNSNKNIMRWFDDAFLVSKPKLIVLTSFCDLKNDEFMRTYDKIYSLTRPVKRSLLYNILVSSNIKNNDTKTEKEKLKLPHFNKIVLIAEDNSINQAVATAHLKSLGCSVDVACNGAQAIDKITQTAYDLVLMDCHMPEMSGYEATTQIRKIKNLKNVPIIALTANALKGEKEKCIGLGMSDFLSKPFSCTDLIEILKKWT